MLFLFALVSKILLSIITAPILYARPCEASTSVGIIEMPSGAQKVDDRMLWCNRTATRDKKLRQNQKLKLLLQGLINEE